ncbi:hypothetical protein CPB84DRAFT_1966857 [Gymnopilus junonius]|uniref:F-box domain-containing protein n=1 Tax=Gymnopilus junonius TaxID=109634 RepID=A0A9P5THB5_GYMJU|nr:hypothetical protein CPB84DRAFT_1966857 [Gymnopilus junonius]
MQQCEWRSCPVFLLLRSPESSAGHYIGSGSNRMHINELPVELLSEVFDDATDKNYLTPNQLTPFLFSFRRKFAPLNLIHVCQHWRMVAFSTPTLWTSLNVAQHKPSKSSVLAMAYWLQCSRNAPLHFLISSWNDASDPSFDRQYARKMLRILSIHLSRWRYVTIEAGNELAGDLVEVLNDAAEHPPPLEGLEINFGYDHDDIAQQSVVDEFASSIYNLKTLRRLYWINAWGHGLPNLPWDQYETIFIKSSFTPEDSLRVLTQCTSAKSVTIRRFQLSNHCLTPFNQPHTSLTSLTSLTLDECSDPLPLLSCFTIPSLLHLEMSLNQREFHLLEEFLKRSNCPLQVLIVADTTLAVDGIASFFKFPWLKSISNVKLAPTYSDKEMQKFLKNLETSYEKLPPLVVWMEMFAHWPVFIGWKESGLQGALYALEAGKLTTVG